MEKFYLWIMLWIVGLPYCVWGQTDTIADQKLREVVVIAKLPVVEMKPGKMTYRMDASITQSQGSVFDVLSSLPGVILQSDGSVYLNGQAGANIMMDGKLTYLSGQDLVSLLKSTPVGVIDKVDLITHPSARYDASGNAGIQKKIWGGRGTVQLFARDVFHSNVSEITLQAPTQQGYVKEWQDNAVIGISLSYRLSRGLEVKESRRKHRVDQSNRINL